MTKKQYPVHASLDKSQLQATITKIKNNLTIINNIIMFVKVKYTSVMFNYTSVNINCANVSIYSVVVIACFYNLIIILFNLKVKFYIVIVKFIVVIINNIIAIINSCVVNVNCDSVMVNCAAQTDIRSEKSVSTATQMKWFCLLFLLNTLRIYFTVQYTEISGYLRCRCIENHEVVTQSLLRISIRRDQPIKGLSGICYPNREITFYTFLKHNQ